MSLTLSELQSLRDKTRAEINRLEDDVTLYKRKLPSAAVIRVFGDTATNRYNRKQIRILKKQIAKLVSTQKHIKTQIRNIVAGNKPKQVTAFVKTQTFENGVKTLESPWKSLDISSTNHQGVGDVNGTERGTSARFNTGKADLSLIPLWTLYDEARVWMYGAEKYSRNNWKRGMVWSIPLACALRHLSAWQDGEDIDQESGQPHLAHAMCNLRMLTYYAKEYQEGDDRK